MKIKSLNIKNFRLLENINDLELDLNHTIIVWRNNSWKTSLTELFKKFFNEWWKFEFNDFSINAYAWLKDSLNLYKEYKAENNDEHLREDKYISFIRAIPEIELNIKFLLEDWDEDLEFIWDLDDESNEYIVSMKLWLKNKILLFENIIKLYWEDEDFDVLNYFKINFDEIFAISQFFIDWTWMYHKLKKNLSKLFKVNFIDAQRDLDDNSSDNNNTLSKIFENYFKRNNEWSTEKDMNEILLEMNTNLDKEYESFFDVLHTDLKTFWYPWLSDKDRKLSLKSELCASELMKWNNSKIYYSQWSHSLPESYNGLWYSNLVYIILQFSYLYWEFTKIKPNPQFQLLFIEEPEAHLHPQMQQTFIKQIEEFINSKWWNVQIVLTTHSSHIITYSDFRKIRYFKKDDWKTDFKDLNKFHDIPSNIEFLKKYLTIERSDIFFADKLILVEWTVERLLMPLFINNIDEEIQNIDERLSSQYISIIEVWWAYSHKFEKFLDFIWIKTLIITDIDSVDKKTKQEKIDLWYTWKIIESDDLKEKAYRVSHWKYTSNYTLINWIPWNKDLNYLLNLPELDKEKSNYRIAYQVEENWNTWRSFEDAFILANFEKLEKYNKDSEILKNKFNSLTKEQIKDQYWDLACYIDKNNKKTNFAFDIMLMDSFIVPKYIKDGLIWLSK